MRRGLRGSPLRSVLSPGALSGGRCAGGKPMRGSPCLPVKFDLCSRPSSSGRSLGREGTAGRAAPLRDCCHRSASLEGARGSFSSGQERSGRCFFQPFPSPGIAGLANTAVFGKQNPSTSQCCLGVDSSEGKAGAGLLFCLLFSKFLEEKKKKKGAGCFSSTYHCKERGRDGEAAWLAAHKNTDRELSWEKNEWR